MWLLSVELGGVFSIHKSYSLSCASKSCYLLAPGFVGGEGGGGGGGGGGMGEGRERGTVV